MVIWPIVNVKLFISVALIFKTSTNKTMSITDLWGRVPSALQPAGPSEDKEKFIMISKDVVFFPSF